MYSRPLSETLSWIEEKYGADQQISAANRLAVEGGMAFAQASELFLTQYQVQPAKLAPGRYRNITGNMGIALGLVAAGELIGKPVLFSGYPITPASDILHELSRYKNFGVTTIQAEDEIAACCAAIGASYGGRLGITASSGPGICLKQEAIGLAISTELPLVIINVQRAGPSTGMPTKTEQADLLEVLFGRNSESPCVVIAIASPGDAFETTIEACRIALEHMIPVFLLSDGYIGNGSEPWRLPDVKALQPIKTQLVKEATAGKKFLPFDRDQKTLVRRWAVPGMAGYEHRIGGLEKANISGGVSYDPLNHEQMVQIRAQRVERVADRLPPLQVSGPKSGDLLVVSWGGTFAAVAAAVAQEQKAGRAVAHLHLRYLNPLPQDLEKLLRAYRKVLVPELNHGQLRMLLRAKFLIDVQGLNKIQGQPFKVAELCQAIEREILGTNVERAA
jgi:2-oxoglutarate ferredoxin oxidoreductase subunit alpha